MSAYRLILDSNEISSRRGCRYNAGVPKILSKSSVLALGGLGLRNSKQELETPRCWHLTAYIGAYHGEAGDVNRY